MKHLPPDPHKSNDRSAAVAGRVMALYRELTNSDDDSALADLLADLMHWHDRNGNPNESFTRVVERACDYYAEETAA
jgi:hypothetical protein